jgi:hypothetical protein
MGGLFVFDILRSILGLMPYFFSGTQPVLALS